MSGADATPVDRLSPLELILAGVNKSAERQVELYEELKRHGVDLKRYRDEVGELRDRMNRPISICVVSAIVCLVSVLARLA